MVDKGSGNFTIDLDGHGYKCNWDWRNNRSPSIFVDCVSLGEPAIFSAKKKLSYVIPLKEKGSTYEPRLNTEAVHIRLGKVELKEFNVWIHILSYKPPSNDEVKETTIEVLKDNVLG